MVDDLLVERMDVWARHLVMGNAAVRSGREALWLLQLMAADARKGLVMEMASHPRPALCLY